MVTREREWKEAFPLIETYSKLFTQIGQLKNYLYINGKSKKSLKSSPQKVFFSPLLLFFCFFFFLKKIK